MAKISAMLLKPGKNFTVKSVATDPQALKQFIGGTPEITQIADGIVIISNQDAPETATVNFTVFQRHHDHVHELGTLHGDALFVGETEAGFTTLTKEQKEYVKQMFQFGRDKLLLDE